MYQHHRADTASEVLDLHIYNRIRCTAIVLVWAFLTPFIAECTLPIRSACGTP
jgi:hypothetical protein